MFKAFVGFHADVTVSQVLESVNIVKQGR